MTSTDWDSYAHTYRQIDESSEVPLLLAAFLSGRSGTLIDVGCGEGSLLNAVRDKVGDAWKLTGFEVSEARADMARKNGHTVIVGDNEVPSDAGQFDVAVSMHVIEHVDDDRSHAVDLARLVQPGGHVYLETPVKLKGAWYFRRNSQAGWVLDPTHLREYRSAAAVNKMLTDQGFEVVAEDLTTLSFPLAAAEMLVKRVAGGQQRNEEPTGWRAIGVRLPRYRQQAVLARKR